eukprot:1187639-Pyramimonas_sp.AAC.1
MHLGDGSVLLVASLYVITSIGLMGGNVALPSDVATVVGQFAVLLTIAADWGADAGGLAASDWCREVAGII